MGDILSCAPLAPTHRCPHHHRMEPIDTNLSGKLLIAMPDMGDPRFAHSVIYICTHTSDGALGLIVNKPQPEIRFSNLLEQLDIPQGAGVRDIRVHFGGPVEMGRGFVLHTLDYRSEMGTLEVQDEIGMTATLDVLEDIAKGQGPDTSMLALGYSGWGPGQGKNRTYRLASRPVFLLLHS